MRDFATGRSSFHLLAATAATVLAVSATGALAQAPAKSPADLAIDAAVPVPEPANVPPPTAADIGTKPDAAADAAKAAPAASEPVKAEAKPAAAAAPETAKAESKAESTKPEAAKADPAKKDEAPATAAAPAAPAATPPAAAASTAPAAAAPAVAQTESPVAAQLRDLLAARAVKYFDRKADRTAVEAFYKDRNYAPLWSDAGALNERGRAVVARLKDAGAEGLDPADYPVPDFAAAGAPEAQADAELKLTASVLDYARHAQTGRMHWSRVSADISYPEHTPDPTEVLINLSTARDASAALEGYNPPHKGYQDLKAKLALLRGQGDHAAPIAEGETLRFVKPTRKNPNAAPVEDARVPALRARLHVENPDDAHYDAKVAEAVRRFQASADLKATGVLDNATVRALNAPRTGRQIDIVRVNMERWRWLPRQLGAPALGDAYVILNIPDFTLKVMQHDKQLWMTRVVTGKPGNHATPMLTETMKYITVNPTWNVPPSIIYNEYLPALQQDPTVLDRMGLKLERNRDGTIHISQPPGEGNALGRIRFNFPNKFLVYQHDTPDKYLFAKEERAFSHGCMRVQNPDQYAAILLGLTLPKEGYTPEKIRSLYGRSEININFPTPIPVNITYQTAFVDDAGKLEFRKDIYGRDAKMIAMLKGAEGRDLETPIAHAQPNYVRPAGNVALPGESIASNGGGGLGFFERLFGAPTPPPAPIRSQRRWVR